MLASALLLGVASLAANVTYAALSAAGVSPANRLESGTVAISDNDSGSAMLSLSSAALGTSDTSCIRATSNGSLDSEVRHYATVTGALAPYLSR